MESVRSDQDYGVTLSTVVLNWNRADLLRKTVQSYLATVKADYELIIVDNNSQDESREFIEMICKDNPHHHSILLTENLGGEALNLGLAQAKGRFLHISENDIEYLPGWDADLLKKFKKFDKLGQLSPFSPFHEVEKGEIWTDRPAVRCEQDDLALYLALDNVGTTCIIRREIWERGARWKAHGTKTYWSPDDCDFSIQVKKLGYEVAWNDKYVVFNWGHNIVEMGRRLDYYFNNAEGKKYLGIERLIKCLAEHGYEVRKKSEGFILEQVVPPRQSQAFARTELWKIWMDWLRVARQELSDTLPEGTTFTLVDEDQFGSGIVSSRHALPFPEQDGQYSGAPVDNDAAIHEIERQKNNESHFLVFTWPSFWWLEYYKDFYEYLKQNFKCLLKNDRLVIFDLREENETTN